MCIRDRHNGVLTVNLAPADVRKEGSSFDLPILLSLINTDASERIDYGGKCFAGELSLTGEVKHITGALPMAISARDLGYKQIFLPEADAAEASAAQGIEVFTVRDVDVYQRQGCGHIHQLLVNGHCAASPFRYLSSGAS